MKRVLFTATVSENHIKVFHLPFLKLFKEMGYEVHVAAKGKNDLPYCDKFYDLSIERSPLKINNLKAYKELKNIINENKYDLIHCHTPMGGVLTRLAARKSRRRGTKVLYTAHGFHFFKGAPQINWKIYYPLEKLLSIFTDCLITINKEDYEIAKKNNFKSNSIELVNGVGIDLNLFKPETSERKYQLRYEYGYKKDDFILIYAAELSHRKHQDLLIDVIDLLKDKIPNVKLLLAGTGSLYNDYQKKVDTLGLNTQIEFLGYRNDIHNLMNLSDVAVSSSRQEGLPVNLMEAMAVGLPVVVTDCRGNRDLVEPNINGFVVGINDKKGFANSINNLFQSEKLRKEFRYMSLEKIKSYSLDIILVHMRSLYERYL